MKSTRNANPAAAPRAARPRSKGRAHFVDGLQGPVSLYAVGVDARQDPESQQNERSNHDPMDWRMKNGGSENQAADDDEDAAM
jgi:hypothetical protein